MEQLRLELNRNARLPEEDFIPKVWIDVPMPIEYISAPIIGELEMLEPVSYKHLDVYKSQAYVIVMFHKEFSDAM